MGGKGNLENDKKFQNRKTCSALLNSTKAIKLPQNTVNKHNGSFDE